MINITEAAQVELNKLVPIGKALKIQVISGGCNGLQYKLSTEDTTDPDFEIIIDKKSAALLAGCTLDYSGGLNGKGFQFNNPKAARTCGCGESFSI